MSHRLFYVAGCSQEADGGIYLFRRNKDMAEAVHFTRLAGVSYLAISPDGRRLYACGNTGPDRAGYVAAFAISEATGIPEALGTCASGGTSCCHLAVSPDGERLYAANYLSGSVAGFLLGRDGSIRGSAEFDQHTGCGTDPERQSGPHAHFTGFTRTGDALLVTDLGTDTIFRYPYTLRNGIDTAAAERFAVTPPGSGPRHLAFEPEGTLLLINEMGNSIQRLKFENGRLELLAAAPTLPEGAGTSKASAVRISPDGRFVLAGNRGADTVAVFERRTLRQLSQTPSGGRSPRDLAFLRDGVTVAVANEFSKEVSFFSFAPETGSLKPQACQLSLPRPLCILAL